MRSPSHPRRLGPLAVAATLVALGCEDDVRIASSPPAAAPSSTSAVTSDVPTAPIVVTRAAEATQAEETSESSGDDEALPAALFHPDGVPFPLPTPLPPEARPRVVEQAPTPEPGPAPLAFVLGGTGTTDGLLNYPRAIVGEADGSVVVVDKTGRLQRFDHEGRLRVVVHTPATGQGKPTGLGVDASGQLLVADTHYCRVLVYGPDLALRRVYGAPGRAGGLFMFISAVKAGPDGLHWTCDYGDEVARVQAFRPDGTWLHATGHFGTGEGELRRPMSLAFDGDKGEVYVADAVNHRIVVLALEGGRWLRTFSGPGREPGQLDFPYDLILDEERRLWVAEFGNQRVTVFDPSDGRCLGTWGTAGRRVGCLARPWGLALGREGRLWVLDSQNDRLYALDRAVVLGAGLGASGSRRPRRRRNSGSSRIPARRPRGR